LNPDYLTISAVTIKQTNSLGLFRLKNTFQILSVVLACLIAAVFPGKVAAGEAGQDEKNTSSQTSNLTQTNEYPDLRLNKDLFKHYLENPYPVRRVVFFEPASVDRPIEVLLCEGSLQPDTFYMQQQASPSVLEDGKYKNVSSGDVAGKSSTGEYWFVDNKAVRGKGGSIEVTSAGDPDSSVTTLAKVRAFESLERMHDACWFGFNFMVPHSVVWHGDDFDMQFLEARDFPHATNTYTVNGEVLAYTNNLPLAIRIKSEHWPKRLISLEMQYEYDFSQGDRFYPVKIIRGASFAGNRQEDPPMTVQISEIEFGDVKPAESGYTATNFTPAEIAIPADVYVSSNRTIYWVNGHQWVRVEPPPVYKKPLFTINAYVRVILIALLLLPAAFLVRWQKKSKSKEN
jgi:hypothetical protein